jgi:CRP-like cAMP-binding protein
MRFIYGPELLDRFFNNKLFLDQLFQGLPRNTARAFKAIERTIFFNQRKVIFSEGQKPRGIYVIENGTAELHTTLGGNQNRVLRQTEANEILGLGTLLAREAYNEATLTALTLCQIGFVKRKDVLYFLQQYPKVSERVIQWLSFQMHSTYLQLTLSCCSQSVAYKLAHFLLDCCERNGEETAQGTRFKMSLTQQDIAAKIGVTRESVTRAMLDFKHKRIINVEESGLFVCDKAALETLCKTSAS